MNAKEKELWTLVDRVHETPSLGKAALEKILGFPLMEKSRIDSTVFYAGDRLERAENHLVKAADFRIVNGDIRKSMMILDVDKSVACIGLDAVRARYPNLLARPPISPPPLGSGQSPTHPPTVVDRFGALQPWVHLIFEFETETGTPSAQCLTGLVFRFDEAPRAR